MKRIVYNVLSKRIVSLFALALCSLWVVAQTPPLPPPAADAPRDEFCERAYALIDSMLSGKCSFDFAEVVFAMDNAQAGGALNRAQFFGELDRMTTALRRIIMREQGVHPSRSMAANHAIHLCYIEGNEVNHGVPFRYDPQSLLMLEQGKQPQGMVSDLLRTGQGNCRSLPFLYKILADRLGAEAYITLAPGHYYIRHPDAAGDWWNFETTVGRFHTSSFIKQNFDIPDRAIRSGLYMRPLSDDELLELCLHELCVIYEQRTGFYYGEFVRRCYTRGLPYNPVSLLQLERANDLLQHLCEHAAQLGLYSDRGIKRHPLLQKEIQYVESVRDTVHTIGYVPMSPETYARLIKEGKEYLSR